MRKIARLLFTMTMFLTTVFTDDAVAGGGVSVFMMLPMFLESII